MQVLTFLGKGNYYPATYQFKDKKIPTSGYFVEFIRKFFKPEKVYFVVTDAAYQNHKSKIKTFRKRKLIRIKDGINETELWDNFQRIADEIPYGAEIIIDITHGYRSLPLMALAAAFFLQTSKSVKIHHILYGAFEVDKDIKPVFDLKPFLHLLNWTFAADVFLQKGDARLLFERIPGSQTIKKRGKENIYENKLSEFGGRLLELTDALALIRTAEIIEQSGNINSFYVKAMHEFDKFPDAAPLRYLFAKVSGKFSSMFSTTNDLFSLAGFSNQCAIIDFYLHNRMLPQAITLAREALISKMCMVAGKHPIEQRRDFEDMFIKPSLGKLLKWYAHKRSAEKNKQPIPPMPVLEISKEALDLYNHIAAIRNDIDHAAMRQYPKRADELSQKVFLHCEQVKIFLQA